MMKVWQVPLENKALELVPLFNRTRNSASKMKIFLPCQVSKVGCPSSEIYPELIILRGVQK